MKKALLLSVVASTMIMAGGDIAPVQPIIDIPTPVAVSSWNFEGNGVTYFQTTANDTNDFFSGASTTNDIAVQLRMTNSNVAYGIGTGIELTGHYGSSSWTDNGGLQNVGTHNVGAAVTQAYLTYGYNNTNIKLGRQHLPQSLSPFAFTETWQPVKNSFDAAVIVNNDLPDTTLVFAYVAKGNGALGDLSQFNGINSDDDAMMITAQNKSIDGLTLTASYYTLPDAADVIWVDGKFDIAGYTLALQGGSVMADAAGSDDTKAFGMKVAKDFGMFKACLAYSSVSDGTLAVDNQGTHVKTPLYTQMVLNQEDIKLDSDTIKVAAKADLLGGTVGLAYGYSDMGATNAPNAGVGVNTGAGEYSEFDLTYSKDVTILGNDVKVFGAYVMTDDDRGDDKDAIRVWARYNFN